ncbi:SigB/SigF/SigG family RNA polymerase sigma factor [Thermoleophilia bacterium SCSIO 60948]|nr:SigB/SigF/SigG family RNA polymerase sigma factor [Thermoleophilia bacterium SCSIO 60948]
MVALRTYARTHDPLVRDELIRSYMPLVRSLAMRYRGGSEPVEDLVQVASLGLVKAVEGFDPDRGRSFNAYAVPTILGELRRHFRDHVWRLHLPRGLQELTIRVTKASDDLREETGESPTVTQLAERLGASEEDVLEALQAEEARRTLSLDVPKVVGDEESAPAIESIGSDDSGFDAVEAGLAAGSAPLDEREWRVLRMRFEDEMTQYEIGQVLGVSQMQISRIMRKALRKLLLAVRGEEGDPAAVAA